MGVSQVADFARNSLLNSINGATPAPVLATRGRQSKGPFNGPLVSNTKAKAEATASNPHCLVTDCPENEAAHSGRALASG